MRVSLTLAAIALTFSANAVAQDAPAEGTAPSVATEVVKEKPKFKRVCTIQQRTGSRLGSQKSCKRVRIKQDEVEQIAAKKAEEKDSAAM